MNSRYPHQREADIILFPPHETRHNLAPVTARPVCPVTRPASHARALTGPPRMPSRMARSLHTVWEQCRFWLTALAVLTAVTTVVAVMWLMYLAVMAVIVVVTTIVTWISAHLLLIVIAAVALVFAGTGTAACTGMHCGGCRR